MILYGCIPRFFQRHRNVTEFVCLYAAVTFYSLFLDESKEQRLVAASCVFPRNVMLSSPPSFLICVLLQVHVPSFMYITGACHVHAITFWSDQQYCNLKVP